MCVCVCVCVCVCACVCLSVPLLTKTCKVTWEDHVMKVDQVQGEEERRSREEEELMKGER